MYLRFYCTYGDKAMPVTLHIRCHVHRTSAGLYHVNSGLCQTKRNCCFTYSWLIIQITVSPFALQICRRFDARYTPLLLPNTLHIIWFELCNVWAQTNSAYLQLCIFRRNVQILHIQMNVSWFLCRLFDAQNTPHMLPNQPVCAMLTLDPTKFCVVAHLHIQA